MKKLVEFAIKYRQNILEMQGRLVKYQMIKVNMEKNYHGLEQQLANL